MHFFRPLLQCLLSLVGFSGLLQAELDPHLHASSEQIAFFDEKVLPILEEHCFKCHGGKDKLKGEFRITSREGLFNGGELGPAIDLKNPPTSQLLRMVRYEDPEYEMPPKNKLPDAAIAVLEEWFAMGAPYNPEKEIHGSEDEHRGFEITEKDRSWWAYKKLERPGLPTPKDPNWARDAIDKFITARHDAEGLTANPDTDPRAFIRRASYDLIGLPPSFQEVKDFTAAWQANADQAVAELVNRLLASPHYGEKWARHWLDLVRYAETNGFERDNPKPHIWKYRDYVVRAFNEDKPYDRFILEQLAGDELDEVTLDSLTATGYHRLMQWDDEPADRLQHRYDVLDDNVSTTAQVFLASTIGCARCHDHKADPISQKDYYAFMSYFHGITDYKTQGTIVPFVGQDEITQLETARDREIARLEAELLKIETQAAATAGREGIPIPCHKSGRVLVEDARAGNAQGTWWYTTSEPDPEWHSVGFTSTTSWSHASKPGFGKQGTPNARVNTDWHTKDIWLRTQFRLAKIPPHATISLYHDEDCEVYLNGQLLLTRQGYVTNYQTITLDAKQMQSFQTGKNTIAIHCRQKVGGQFIDLGLKAGAGADGVINRKAFLIQAKPQLREALTKEFGVDLARNFQRKYDRIRQLRSTPVGQPVNAVTEANSTPAPLHVHIRGSAHAKGDAVEPRAPEVMVAPALAGKTTTLPESYKRPTSSGRRRALAEWIASPQNPLTARVIANRVWQHHFGRGICPSPSDFGRLGEKPTHPKLLDHLATSLIDTGWSLKSLHRKIMNSRAYRMSSSGNSSAFAQDPQNNLLWRVAMRRLTAEELRDSILHASGQLKIDQLGGPWIFPPLPREVLATSSKPESAWGHSPADQHGRRSIYVHVKRSLRHPFLADFDQADTDVGVAARFATTVPTQALGMLNSGFVNRQAEAFASTLEGDSDEDKIRHAYRRVLSRDATDHELASLTAVAEQLGLARACLVVLNLNEFAYLD